MNMAKRTSSSSSPSLSELLRSKSEDGKEACLFDFINKSSVVDEAKASSPPSPRRAGLGI
ncbi:MAG: hypothetical protein COS09_01125 [Candidatus Nealsonbacteria bacterium CG01_land_8_20_14_3_00_12]|uniref:Uncharacterized protein n=1 Tax=Candidatus Nealsonbacteria bacterium CG01_land_8_20_14_3_00_12 TaxID=1974697 RepID=A0A2M7EBT5_9BACT|nr:MAG: hypothetical protein COS09_01125 [Candidatus Nealsonbacteria bacterium CG01_land_8_20_14_3_00_12]